MDDKRRRYIHSVYTPHSPPRAREALVAIDNYRNCTNDEISFLRQENQEMRMRLAKIAEIESRVESLLVRDQHNLAENERLRLALEEKLVVIDELRAALQCQRRGKAQVESAMRTEIESLMAELAWINRDRDQQRIASQRKYEEIRLGMAKDREYAQRQLQNALQQAERQCHRFEESLQTVCAEKDHNQREYTALRLRMMDQLEELSGRVDHLSRDVIKSQSENEMLRMQVSSLSGQAQQLKQLHELATVDKLRSDQQRAQILLDLKEVEKQLASASMDCNVYEQRMLATQAELARMSEFCKQNSLHIDELQAEIRKKNRLLDEFNTQLQRSEEASHAKLSSTMAKLAEAESCLDLLRKDNNEQALRSNELQIEGESKTSQIRQLLYCIENLEAQLLELESKCRILESEGMAATEKNSFFLQERQNHILELRSMQDKLMLKDDQLRNLEDLSNKKEKELQELRKSSGKFENMIKKYEDEMLRMVRLFEEDKAVLEERFLREKARLKELYEYELKDTQDLFERKVRVLEEGLKQ